MRKRESQPRPNPQQAQPHDSDRDERQPYAKELDDYAHGVVNPPEEQVSGQEKSSAGRDDRRTITPPLPNQYTRLSPTWLGRQPPRKRPSWMFHLAFLSRVPT